DTSLPRYREQIQTEFVVSQSNLTRLETSSHQDRPEIAFAVIHFVIVHLYFRTEAKPESSEFQKSLSEPCRNIHKEEARWSEQSPGRLEDNLWLSKVLQDRDNHHYVHHLPFQLWQSLLDGAFMDSKSCQALQ